MSAITPTALYTESAGSLKEHIATFAAGATSLDTWASGIPGVVFQIANCTGVLNTVTNYQSVEVAHSSGTFTFRANAAETMTAFTLMVLSKS